MKTLIALILGAVGVAGAGTIYLSQDDGSQKRGVEVGPATEGPGCGGRQADCESETP